MLILAVQVFENGFVVDTVMKIMGHGLVGRMFWCATFGNRRGETLPLAVARGWSRHILYPYPNPTFRSTS